MHMVEHQIYRTSVESDLTDVEAFAQLEDELLNETVVNDVAFRGFYESLRFPFVIHDMVSADAERERFFSNMI